MAPVSRDADAGCRPLLVLLCLRMESPVRGVGEQLVGCSPPEPTMRKRHAGTPDAVQDGATQLSCVRSPGSGATPHRCSRTRTDIDAAHARRQGRPLGRATVDRKNGRHPAPDRL
jgi:hypothetical protein